ncbi:hypothetical protein QQM39_20880 [Streptomyces sp. DT2A-34]|uniref:hypothetical protein n=1 Tax=Streptomyces sp. DT2A-34 TaxID=3051182 RepID=UPI00265C406F|nr:hypothetical protein [Streptomyces sp. DT2A-34]MDO0913216.1 hypothetical protein [Streptomyces sp. DT2A-34]
MSLAHDLLADAGGDQHAGARVCARAGGADLTRDQWRTYVPDAPYRKVCGG